MMGLRRIVVVGLMLLGVANARSSFCFGQTTTEIEAAGTARQRQWLVATPSERVRLAEALGEDGARATAKAKGFEPVFDGFGRTLPQGPDQVYRASDGRVIVFEAKGGSGQLGRAYGHVQGTTEWAVESASRVLQSAGAGNGERGAAREILEAAARGQLEVHVIRTGHVLGEPTAAVLEGVATSTDDAARLARLSLDDLANAATQAIDDVARSADDVARAAAESGSILKTVSRAAVPVAVVVDAGLRVNHGIETERRLATGEIAAEQREIAHAKNVAGAVGGWAGAWVGTKLGAMGGGAAGSMVAPGPGTAVGGVVGGVAGGVAGYIGGEEVAEEVAKWTVNRFHAAGTTVAEMANAAWNNTVSAANSAAEGVSGTWLWIWGE